jgi:hypothetical protein
VLRLNYVGNDRGSQRASAQVPLPSGGEAMTPSVELAHFDNFAIRRGAVVRAAPLDS